MSLNALWFSEVAERMNRFTISFRVLGPLVTFRVSPGVHNLTAADVAKAAGKAGSRRIISHLLVTEKVCLWSVILH